ncbi:MAG: selenocysteine-specific translation elongation factor, partial [Planctomycetota bacterium]
MTATPSASDPTPATVGTAGHIDHGKTQLIERLTGMRADRPQERERGMTIDIGYAEMRTECGPRIGFVDLPGHERFIRNMVAGATGIDLALLVVAADDGVMPQTREHTDILGLLGVSRGVAVLNKVDLVDDETRQLGLEELRDFLAGTSLRGAPVVACSAATGEGVDELAALLQRLVAQIAAARHPGAFFMAVQRRFAAAGFGCIATGVPSAGGVETGGEVELLPAGRRARVRAIEVYHEPADRARAGHRVALNLAGVRRDDVARGMVVARPGVYAPSRHVAATLSVLASSRRAVKHAGEVRLLSGTFEEMAAVYLAEGDALRPGAAGLVELRCRSPVVVRDGDPFIVRTSNARETIGGGRVVSRLDGALGRRDTQRRAALARRAEALDDPARLLRTVLDEAQVATAPGLAVRCQLTVE